MIDRLRRPLSMIAVLLVLAAGGALAYRRVAASNETYTVTAYFEKGIGLFENSDVTILGVPIGKVSEVEPEGDRVRVMMQVRKEYQIPVHARAMIVPISVISDRYVQFDPPYERGAALADGDVLGVARTSIPAELDDVFKQLKKLLDAIEPGRPGEPGALGELVVQLDETLSDKEADLQGTLVQAADLTRTLSEAEDDISGLLVNLDDLFGTLATRAGSIGTLNENLAIVMTTLAESRHDLQGTLENLGEMTLEVGDVLREHRDRLGVDLERARKVMTVILRNRASVEESLSWLPVVGAGLAKARHPEPIDAVDVRDNVHSKFCDDLPTDLPDPIQDFFDELLAELCPPTGGAAANPKVSSPPLAPPAIGLPPFDCDAAINKVKRRLRELARLDLPQEVEDELLPPLNRKIRKLAKKCDELADRLKEADLLDDLLRELPDVGELPEIPEPEARSLTGNAAGADAGVTVDDPRSDGPSWLQRLVNFLGWSA